MMTRGSAAAGKPRRILLLVTDLEIGGTPTVVRELAKRLNAPPGATVEVASLKPWGPVSSQLREAGVRVTALNASAIWRLPRTVRRLRRLIREREIDTVFSFLLHANAIAALASRALPGVRYLQSIQTIQPTPKWHWRVQRRIHRFAEAIIVPSSAVARVAGDRCRIPTGKIVVIPNAVDPADFPRVEVFRDPRRVRAGYLGRLDPAKSPAVLLGALTSAAMEGAELHFFGEGPERAKLESHATSPAGTGRLFVHGAVAAPQDALRQMDVLWLPSIVEGFGLVLIEAMASGVPVVACKSGGVEDVVIDHENGLLATDPTHAALFFARSLEKLRSEPDLRRKLIENGLRTVREKFTWDVVLSQYRRLLRL